MKDKKCIENFAKRCGLEIVEYNEPDFIHDKGVKKGGVRSLCLTSSETKESMVDFIIEKNDNVVGYATDSSDSFVEVK